MSYTSLNLGTFGSGAVSGGGRRAKEIARREQTRPPPREEPPPGVPSGIQYTQCIYGERARARCTRATTATSV